MNPLAWGAQLARRARYLLRRDAAERDMDEEMRLHLALEIEERVRNGLAADEARRTALADFGGVERFTEEGRTARGARVIEDIAQEVRYAVRGLRARPAFTLGVALTLGLGIGANAAMFGVVDRLLFRAPPFLRDADRVHRIFQVRVSNGREVRQSGQQFPRYLDLVRDTHSFSTFAAFASPTIAIGEGVDTRQVPIAAASASYFDLFDARPALGRFFTPDDDRAPVGSPVVVLGYAFWQTQYGGKSDVLGLPLRVGRTLCTIIGVAPEGFTGVADEHVPALYIPITTHAWDLRGSDLREGYDYTKNYAWHWFQIIARRKPDVSIAAATADLSSAMRISFRAEYAAGSEPGERLEALKPRGLLAPIQTARGPDANGQAMVAIWLSGVALIVLLIACANVANLLLARAVSRRREIALRLALGVSRLRLVRQLLTESLVLAVLGVIVGLATAQWGGSALRALFLPPDFGAAVVTDKRTLAVALIVTVAAAILTGLAPVSQAIRYKLASELSGGGRNTGAARSRTDTALLLFQAALSVVLLVGAGLFVRSLNNVRAMHLGFDVDPLVAVTINLRGTALTDTQRVALERELTSEARRVPGVVAATQSPSVPFWGFEERRLFVPGVDSVERLGSFFMQAGNGEFFRTLGTRILRGRALDDHDGPNSTPAIVVSDRMAAALWPGQEPLGKCIRIERAGVKPAQVETAPCAVVIGIAEEMHIRTLDERADGAPSYTYSIPISQYDYPAGMLLVRVDGHASDYASVVGRALQRSMPGTSYVTTAPLQNMVDPEIQQWRAGATMFVAFAALALVMAGVGLYSVIAYGIAQRRKEIGVRLALGASRAHVVRHVMKGGLQLVLVGVALGGIVALWASRFVASLLFNESPTDPAVYAIVAAVLMCVALVACAVPALRASRVAPNVVLRGD
jgi:putative ABC transport system permease protein